MNSQKNNIFHRNYIFIQTRIFITRSVSISIYHLHVILEINICSCCLHNLHVPLQCWTMILGKRYTIICKSSLCKSIIVHLTTNINKKTHICKYKNSCFISKIRRTSNIMKHNSSGAQKTQIVLYSAEMIILYATISSFRKDTREIKINNTSQER